MTINTEERRYEEERLVRVKAVINHLLAERKALFIRLKKAVRKDRKTLWEEGPRFVDSFASAVNLSQQLNDLRYTELTAANNQRTIEKLEKMLHSPYFARIDFQEQGTSVVEAIYIGISSLLDPDGNPLIYDWRAPVSSMFYDYELGPARYLCEAGEINGEIFRKRQYKIENGRLVYMFDCNLKIDDEILQEILSKHSDEKMRAIVTSIQREQNRVIRDDEHPVLLVEGAAGSGKTSIALHRAAYYLYKERDRITSKNILIFSPNNLFADYISNVLPELGEEMVLCTTFPDLVGRFLPAGLFVEDRHNQLEFVLTSNGSPDDLLRAEKIYLQTTPAFLQLIDDYLQFLTEQGRDFADLSFQGELILSKEDLRKLYDQYYAYLPMKKRLVQLQRRAFYLLRPLTKRKIKEYAQKITKGDQQLTEKEIKARSRLALRKELLPLRATIHSWTALDCYQLYRELFANQALLKKMAAGRFPPAVLERLRRAVLKTLNAQSLAYEDLAPFLYFQGKIEGFPRFSQIKHLIIDEAQDYTFFHYQIIKEMFPAATLTILGDPNQAIHPRQYRSSFAEIQKIFSTREITGFTLQLLAGTAVIETDYINRPGPKPQVVQVTGRHRLALALAEKIRALTTEGFTSLAVITKTAREAQSLQKELNKLIPIQLITKEEKTLPNSPLIIPSYLAKGLEFDVVLIADCSREVYGQGEELALFYTVCTRALHRLFLYYTGEPTPFLAKVDPELYTSTIYPE
jgi:DNA helicase-2/ATP-dependent DNA helicase PcrA